MTADSWTDEDNVEMGDEWITAPDVTVIRGNSALLKDEMLNGTDVTLMVEGSHKKQWWASSGGSSKTLSTATANLSPRSWKSGNMVRMKGGSK